MVLILIKKKKKKKKKKTENYISPEDSSQARISRLLLCTLIQS